MTKRRSFFNKTIAGAVIVACGLYARYGHTQTLGSFQTNIAPALSDYVIGLRCIGTAGCNTKTLLSSYVPLIVSSVRLQDFGAVCNGTSGTADQAAWNAAYATLPSYGGEIHIPAGLGCVLGNITTTIPLSIVGDGGNSGQGTIIPSTAATSVFDIQGSFTTIKDVAFQPNGVKQTAGSYIKVEPSAARFVAENITMTEFHEGITINGSVPSVDIKNFRGFLYSTGSTMSTAGLHFLGGLDVKIDGVSMQGPLPQQAAAGIQIDNLGDAMISHADVVSMGTDLLVDPGNSQVVTSLWIDNSFFDTATRGVDLCPTGSGNILRSRFIGYWASSHATSGLRVCSTGTVNGLELIDGHVFLNSSYGVDLEGGSNIRILSGEIGQNGNNGVYVAAGVSNWSVESATIGATGGVTGNVNYGLYVAAGASDYYRIVGNNVVGNTVGGLLDAGTGTHKSVYANLGDANDYQIYRDITSGYLNFNGVASTFSGYTFKGNNGTVLASINNNGGIVATGPVVGLNQNVAAAGTNQATATAAFGQTIDIISGTGGIVLSAYSVGNLPVAITNITGSAVNVYPAVGSNFNGSATNAPYSLAANTQILVTQLSSTVLFAK